MVLLVLTGWLERREGEAIAYLIKKIGASDLHVLDSWREGIAR
jgi:hypothetical protein